MGESQHDYATLLEEETSDLRALAHQLTEEQWDTQSLCDGWRVRDVIGHMTAGGEMGLGQLVGMLVKYRGNVPKGSHEISVTTGNRHPGTSIADAFDASCSAGGILGKVIPKHEQMADHVIHEMDIRIPLGLDREWPQERLIATLDALPKVGGFLKSKQLCAGLSLRATDMDWSWGSGPEVAGPAQALILAVSGRPIQIDQLKGDGVDELKRRIQARQN